MDQTVTDPAPRCIRCGYDLTGLAKPQCPECGTWFDPATNRGRAPLPWLPALLHMVVLSGAFGILQIALIIGLGETIGVPACIGIGAAVLAGLSFVEARWLARRVALPASPALVGHRARVVAMLWVAQMLLGAGGTFAVIWMLGQFLSSIHGVC